MILGLVFLVAVAGAIVSGIYYWQTVSQIPPVAQFPVHKDEMAGWKTYTNTEYGFEFKYPVEWGDVVIKDGNRKDENEGCDGPFGEYSASDSILLYDQEITFSKFPNLSDSGAPNSKSFIEGGFQLTKYDPKNPMLYYCKSSNSGVDLVKDRQKLINYPEGTIQTDSLVKKSIKTISGFKVLYYPDWYDPLGTSISQFNKFYSNNLLVQGGMSFTPYYNSPEELDLESNFKCKDGDKYGQCGLSKWVRESSLAIPVRVAFDTFDQILSTFKFVEPAAAVDTSTWKTYTNTEYGFQLIFTDAWVGYKVEKTTQSYDSHQYIEYLIQVPTSDSAYKTGYAIPFSISVYPLSMLKYLSADDHARAMNAKLGQDDTHLFTNADGIWQDIPTDYRGKNLEINEVKSSFKFTK